MTRIVCTQHGPNCERLHVGMRVAIVGRYRQVGHVVAVTDGTVGNIRVRYEDNGDEYTYDEAELVKL